MTIPAARQIDPAISIIVPVFNVGAWIDEGLQSLSRQKFSEPYEVILVDDCSTDDSLQVCREYATRHEDKFSLIESPVNAGVSNARNLGLERARGRYLMFVDPDDLLPISALADMYAAALHYQADIVKGNLELFNDQSSRPAPDHVNKLELVRADAVLTTLYEHERVRGHVGGKLFRRAKFGALRFTIGVRMAQDLLYFSEMFAQANSLLLLDSSVYLYRKHATGSTGGKYQKGSYIDWLNAVERCGEFAQSCDQIRAHKGLLLRTMTQIARECRDISAASAAPVLETIENKCREWNLQLGSLLFADRLGLRDISRYIKLQLALRFIRRKLSRT